MGLIFAAGLAYALLSLPLIVLQLITLAIFTTQSEYRQLTCYRIMLSIGVADTAQLLVHCIDGLAMMCDYVFTGWAINLLGAVLMSAWMAMVPQHTVLAANRLMVVAEGAEHGTSAREWLVANVGSRGW